MHPCYNFPSVAKCAKSRYARVNEYEMPTNYRRVGINHVMSRRPRLRVGEVLFKAVSRMHNDGSVMCRRWWDANVVSAVRACQSGSDTHGPTCFVSHQPAVYEKLKFRLDTAPERAMFR